MSCVSPVLIPAPFGSSRAGLVSPERGMLVPCGRCLGCSLSRAESWSVRCDNEMRYHDRSSFLTLTYRDENLPSNNGDFPTLIPLHVQKFFKRLRFHYGPFRHLYCGEYGSLTGRPHYHVLAFGYEPDDKVFHSRNHQGDSLYTSASLDRIWGLGNCLVGDLTEASAAYTCRYTVKKQSDGHQVYLDRGQHPPYISMSRRPGIGHYFFRDFGDSIILNDSIVTSSNSLKPIPSYYRKLYRASNPLQSDIIAESKRISALSAEYVSPSARAAILKSRTSSLSRGL